MLKGKKVALGITGGIAAYKVAEVASRLAQRGVDVQVIMTQAAQEFITPLTMRTLTNNPVIVEMFGGVKQWNVEHIALAESAELFVIAPATANMIAKLAHGLADDFLSTTVLATRSPVLVVPAMNHHMYAHAAVQANLARLLELGYQIMEPETGYLACGTVGKGRFPAPSKVVEEIIARLSGGQQEDWSGVGVLISAGPTREPLDPVRFLSNHSSGKMGYALAQAARDRGARVTLVTGPVQLAAPFDVEVIGVETAEEMRRAIMERAQQNQVVIMAAAVADFRPVQTVTEKIKKSEADLQLQLEYAPDILMELGQLPYPRPLLVGFAAETSRVVERARQKLANKQVDLICANDVSLPEGGFGSEDNQVTIIAKGGSVDRLPLMPKRQVADRILDRIHSLLGEVT